MFALQIRASSLRRHRFRAVLEQLDQKILELLRDVETRWSSTFLMLDRALALREVCHFTLMFLLCYLLCKFQAVELFLESKDFTDLHKWSLQDCDWKALEVFKSILEVRLCILIS